MQPFIPVLKNDINQITQPVDIIKYILWAYTHLPKNINDTFNSSEISFRFDDAEAGHSLENMRDRVQANLHAILKRYFPTASVVEVEVDTTRLSDDDGRYTISIDIVVVVNSIPYSISQNYSLDNNGNLEFILTPN